MDYRKHYTLLIGRAKPRLLEGYTERHHVLPRCMGGDDSPENLVDLTAEEHYVAHQLLVKMYPDENKLALAAFMMTWDRRGGRVNNKVYGWLKRRYSAAVSAKKKGHIPWNKGKRGLQKQTAESNAKRSAKLKGRKLPPRTAEHNANFSKAKTGMSIPKLYRPIIVDDVRYSSRKEAVQVLKINKTTLYNWIKRGKARGEEN